MPSPLTSYSARQALATLRPYLPEHSRPFVDGLSAALGDDGQAGVAKLLSSLYPFAASDQMASELLDALVASLNRAAEAHHPRVRVHLSGPEETPRRLWLEGLVDPPPAVAADLHGVRPELIRTDQRALRMGAPVVLLTFNANETLMLRETFGWSGAWYDTKAGDYRVADLGYHGGNPVLHIVSRQAGREAGLAARSAIEALNPCALIAVGIAFGLHKGKQRLGDVLVSKNILDYQEIRSNPDGRLIHRGDKPSAARRLLRSLQELEHAKAQDADWPRLHVGTILTGDELVDNTQRIQQLLSIAPEAVGGEMEGGGLEFECAETKTDWLIVKGISDWGDGTKNSGNKELAQRDAAGNAAKVVKALLELGPIQEITPPEPPKPPAQPSPRFHDLEKVGPHCLTQDGRGLSLSLQRADLGDISHEKLRAQPQAEGVPVLDELLRWAKDANAPRVMALLGEYGMGKTISCQQFAQRLDEARRADARIPMPLYFDLRDALSGDGQVPTLAETVANCMKRGWNDLGGGAQHDLDQVHRWIAEGAVVIFDGLDEVLVKLTANQGQQFTSGLFKLFSDARERAKRDHRPAPTLKILIACRTNYFATLRDQKSHFVQQDRGEIAAEDFRALLLLPWTEEQITKYLASALPDLDPEQVIAMIRSVHNLEELAARPYTLKLIADYIPDIERLRAQGRPVQGVTLYRAMANRWLERDDGKHHIQKPHKLGLAAHLAATLWRQDQPELTADALQSWFHNWRSGRPELKRYDGLHPDQLEEDLRTATFLSRRDEGDHSAFRFAHTSLLEYFLAVYLYQAAQENRPEDWALRCPSQESLDFLGQIFAENAAPLSKAEGWRTQPRPQTNALLLAYARRALGRGYPSPALDRIDLSGVDLQDQRLGADAAPLSLRGAVLRGCDLRRGAWRRIDLTGADLSDARLDQALFQDCVLAQADLSRVEATATVFRRCDLTGARWDDARGHRPHFVYCKNIPVLAAGFEAPQIAPNAAEGPTGQLVLNTRPFLKGTASSAWAPDGTRFVVGNDDGALSIWDALSGDCLYRFRTADESLLDCAWSADGRWIVSIATNSTLSVWDADTGALAHSHNLYVPPGINIRCAAFSPDLRRLAIMDENLDISVCRLAPGPSFASRLMGGLPTIPQSSGYFQFVWSQDSKVLLTQIGENARCTDANTLYIIDEIIIHQHVNCRADLSPDGGAIAYVKMEDGLFIRSVNHPNLQQLSLPKRGWVCLAWSPCGRWLALRGWGGGTVLLQPLLQGQEPVTFSTPVPVTGGRWSCDGDRLLLLSANPVGVWSLQRQDWLWRTTEPQAAPMNRLAWSPHSAHLAFAGWWSGLRLAACAQAPRLTHNIFPGTTTQGWRWSQDDHSVTLLRGAGEIWQVSPQTGAAQKLGQLDWNEIHELDFTQDGHIFAALGRTWPGEDGRLKIALYDRQGRLIRHLLHNDVMPYAFAFSPSGAEMAVGYDDGALALWALTEDTPRLCLPAQSKSAILFCAWSPCGQVLAAGSRDGWITLWDLHAAAEHPDAPSPLVRWTAHSGWVRCGAWSPDGRYLASGGGDGAVRVWDATNGALVRELIGHRGDVNSCAWSPDGRKIASCGNDGTLRIWNADSGVCETIHAQWVNPDKSIGFATWSPQTNEVFEATDDAWRALGWSVLDQNGVLQRLPLEAFGPIPAPSYRVIEAPSGSGRSTPS